MEGPVTSGRSDRFNVVIDNIVRAAVGLLVLLGLNTYLSIQDLGNRMTRVETLVSVTTNGWKRVDDLDTRMRAIENNRFTAQDGIQIWKELMAVQSRIPDTWPAPETRGELETIRGRIDRLEKDVETLGKK